MKRNFSLARSCAALPLILLLAGTGCASREVWVSTNAPDPKGIKLALLDFDIRDKKTGERLPQVGTQFSTALSTGFMKAGFAVIDRKNIGVILKEQEFQQTGIVDPKTAVKFANIMGVRYVVFGSGRANPTGSRSYHFLHEATITMLDAQSGEQVMVATWSGAGVEPVSAARKIGDEIAEKWTKR
ncbi:MAG TPA: CsgG/HfaB family protein [Spirochaetota bacterium]|nr:CsgG/HfaB family protein [Spirochaetota bacterium]HNT10250.1 CsgG/HfaB family protein [Spirochaetota bacterium]HNV47441.1 CsgG/HfaB family protein [Spirochaetota bacterium]HOS40579.1 CsgG/HfaB family protein [Spirochaetota bacterium]HPI22074.1 CsgG/HfaB family protein [Spirochaetota bacterium]